MSASHQQIRFCTAADGVRIAYALVGEGPPLVKAANWLTHVQHEWQSPVWRHWLRELSRDHTLVRYDERGCGLSDWNVEDLSFEAWVRDLETVIDTLGLERFPLLGISQGGPVSVAYTVRHPERVSHLILCGSYAVGWRKRSSPEIVAQWEALTKLIQPGWRQENSAFRQVFTSLFIPGGTPEQARWFEDLLATTSPEMAVRFEHEFGQIDVREFLPQVQAPTLVLHARNDAVIPYEAGLSLAEAIPGARFVPLEGNNHVLLGHEPAWPHFLAELRAFLGIEAAPARTLDTAGWDRLSALFERAVALLPDERQALLDAVDDIALRDELEALLAADARSGASIGAVVGQAFETSFDTHFGDPVRPGQTIAHYRIEERLGGGGMGVVYRAHDTRLGRTVALKFLPPHLSLHAEARQRFIHEARAASALDHPNICTIYDISETADGRSFIAMACYDGETLKARLAQGRLPVESVLDYGAQMAEGLARAHEAGIVHRDIKPANVMVTARGRVKLLDFGIAKMAGLDVTRTGATLGTVAYMSPEQTRGEAVDHRTDLWALGVVLYEMLSGERPFRGGTEQALIYAVLHDAPVPLATLRPEVPEGLARLVHRLLEKNPDDRLQHADDVAAALHRLARGDDPHDPFALPAGTLTLFFSDIEGSTRLAHRLGTRYPEVLAAHRRLVREALRQHGGHEIDTTGDGFFAVFAHALQAVAAAADLQRAVAQHPWPAEAVVRLRIGLHAGEPDPTESRHSYTGLAVHRAARICGVGHGGQVLLSATVRERVGDRWPDGVTARDLGTHRLKDFEEPEHLFQLDIEGLPSAFPRLVSAAEPAAEPVAVADERQASIAVLPFADMSPNRDQAYFCEGVAEELINALSRIEGLRVASRTSSFAARNAAMDIRTIGEYLQVDSVLEGSVRKAGDRLRVTVQLVDTADGYQRWSARYDRDLEDVFAVQDEIAENTVRALRGVLTAADRAAIQQAPSTAPEAYEEYLQGRRLLVQGNRPSLENARRLFERAIEVDPTYAPAYAGIAFSSYYLYLWSRQSEADREAARQASHRAVELAPQLAESHVALGLALTLDERFDEAEQAMEAALRLDDRSYDAHYFYGRVCFAQGKLEQTARLFERAAALDPNEYQAACLLAQVYEAMGDTEAAQAQYRTGFERAQRHLALNPNDVRAISLGASGLFMMGQRARGLEWTRRAVAMAPEDPIVAWNAACNLSQAGELDAALDSLERAVALGIADRRWLEHDPDMDPLRAHPRFQAVLAGMT